MRQRGAFSLFQLLAVVTVAAVILAMLIPALRAAREASRRMICSNNLKQLGLAVHNYHSNFKNLPSLMSGTEANRGQLSGLIATTPFVEASLRWDVISNPSTFNGISYPAMGPPPTDTKYEPWLEQIPSFNCPTEYDRDRVYGRTNYAFCIGDQITGLYSNTGVGSVRGCFAPGLYLTFYDITDGMAQTILMTEIANKTNENVLGNFSVGIGSGLAGNPGLCLQVTNPDYPNLFRDDVLVDRIGRGGCLADGSGGFGWVNTILPPNSPSCAVESQRLYEGVFSASSRHIGGAHVMFADGAVVFVWDSIDAGDASEPLDRMNSESPYGLWGALGTRGGEEVVEETLVE